MTIRYYNNKVQQNSILTASIGAETRTYLLKILLNKLTVTSSIDK